MNSTISTVSTNGRLVIPSALRRRFGIRQGTRVALIEDGGRIILQPITREYIRSLRGSLKAEQSALSLLLETRRPNRES
jgi:AbrB family looped-hinge helix DNA binding protein